MAAIDRLVADTPESNTSGLLAATLSAIEQHLALEETSLYPLLRAALPNGESEVVRRMAHTELIEQSVTTLRSSDLSPQQRAQLITDLGSLMRRHVDGHEARYAHAISHVQLAHDAR